MLCDDCHLLCNNSEAKNEAGIHERELVPDKEVVKSYMVDYPHKPNFVALKESA